MQAVPSDHPQPFAGQTVLIDATHGQAHWAQTGYASREMHSNFAGLAQRLCRFGGTCVAVNKAPLVHRLDTAQLLILPPPTGRYDGRKECWLPNAASLFSAEEMHAILAFVRAGGRLLAFAYRFGDSFTRTNLRDLFNPLGCLLHDDAVVDVTSLRTIPALQSQFSVTAELLPMAWFRRGVQQLRCRPMSTFTIWPGATAQPILLSPGGCCLTFDRTQRRISFASRPMGVAGVLGQGRFVLLGGPHLFETGTYGLLNEADNHRFLDQILRWLLRRELAPLEGLDEKSPAMRPWLHAGVGDVPESFSQVDGRGRGEATVVAVERMLSKTGVLKALSRARWMP